MCTNDLYLCKDSSRINCTLACSTLGYIPCRNYVDKKICASVNKKSSGRFFSLKSASGSAGDLYTLDTNGRFQLDSDENNNNLFFKNININEKFLFSGRLLFKLTTKKLTRFIKKRRKIKLLINFHLTIRI